ncbi:MAG: hypothetical protein V4479_10600 [Actinomycetota bacterium]
MSLDAGIVSQTDTAIIAQDNNNQLVEMAQGADATIKSAADRWSTGVSALFALVIAGAWISGPASADKIEPARLAEILWWAGAGLILDILALVVLLVVSAGGSVRKLDAATVAAKKRLFTRKPYVTVRAYRDAIRMRQGVLIRVGAILGVGGLVPMLIGLALWITAPAPTPVAKKAAEVSLTVQWTNGPTCGAVVTSDLQVLVLKRPGYQGTTAIPYAEITNLTPVSTCD